MRVALVYDRVNKWGGAERVLLALHELFPDAPLYTSIYSKKNAKWANEFKLKTSFIQRYEFLRDKNEFLAGAMPIIFESFNFDKFDVVISITSESSKGIITKPGTIHICYCLTPTRYLWTGYDDYFNNKFVKFLSSPLIFYLKKWDIISSSRPDYYISISNEVKKRVKKYYLRDSKVIFPPVLIGKNEGAVKVSKNEYYLLVSRMSRFTYYKKVDLVIEAFNENKLKLVVVGSGSMLGSLKAKANKNIKFVGSISDKKLISYYRNAKSLIFPGFEDFGLVMAEAQSFGIPVIAYGKGGARDIVIPGKTGELFNKQTVASLNSALQKFNQSIYNKRNIIENSKRFSYKTFKKEFELFIKEVTK